MIMVASKAESALKVLHSSRSPEIVHYRAPVIFRRKGTRMEIIMKRLEEIKPYEKNPRKNDEAVEYVANSIRDFGFKNPIIIDRNGVIVAGHTRLKAAERLGLQEVPCIMADDLTEEQVKAFRLADNKTAELAGWELNLLGQEIEALEGNFDFTEFGFGEFELESIIGDFEPEPYDKEIEEQYDKGEEMLARRRVIVTYDEETEPLVRQMLNVEEIKQVVYRIEDLASN